MKVNLTDYCEVTFQFRVPSPNRGPLPQQITKAEIVSPLAAAVFNHVKMNHSDVRGRVHNKQVASCICMIASVTIADIGQPVDQLRQ